MSSFHTNQKKKVVRETLQALMPDSGDWIGPAPIKTMATHREIRRPRSHHWTRRSMAGLNGSITWSRSKASAGTKDGGTSIELISETAEKRKRQDFYVAPNRPALNVIDIMGYPGW